MPIKDARPKSATPPKSKKRRIEPRRRSRRPSPDPVQAYERVPVDEFLSEEDGGGTPQRRVQPIGACLIGRWMDHVQSTSCEMRDILFRSALKNLERRDAAFLDMIEGFAGAAAHDLSDLMRRPTAAEEELMKGMDATDRMKLTYFLHKESFVPVMSHLDKIAASDEELAVFAQEVTDLYEKTVASLDTRAELDKVAHAVEAQKTKLGLQTEEDDEEEEEGEDDSGLLQTYEEQLAKLEKQYEVVHETMKRETAAFTETYFGVQTNVEFPVKKERCVDALIGSKLRAVQENLSRALGNPVAEHIADLCDVFPSAPIGANGDDDRLGEGMGVVRRDPINFVAAIMERNMRNLGQRERDREARIRREEIRRLQRDGNYEALQDSMLRSLSPMFRASIERSLDRTRGLMGTDDLFLIDIERDSGVLSHFRDLVGIEYAEREFDLAARRPGGRYHAFRNKEDYQVKRAEAMEWLQQVSFDPQSREFTKRHAVAGVRLPTYRERTLDPRPPYYPGEARNAGEFVLLMRRRGSMIRESGGVLREPWAFRTKRVGSRLPYALLRRPMGAGRE